MSRVTVTFELSNYRDVVLVRHGLLKPDQVRRVTVEGTVHPNVMHAVLPKSVVDALGLPLWEMRATRDGEKCDMVKDAFVQFFDRDCVFNAIVELERTEVQLGAIVLGMLDVIVDRDTNTLMPRDPNGIICEVE